MNRTERLENLSAYIDGELTEQEQRLLAAWCEHHPEDVSEYEALAEVVRQVRGLPLVEPPAGLRDSIVRALAEVDPVSAPREKALEWLDDYLDGELSEPRRAVVEHYLAVDAEFAELAELQAAMLDALTGLREAEPPSDLKARIEASVRALEEPAHARARPRAPRLRWPVASRRRLTLGAAAALLLCGVSVGLLRGPRSTPVTVAEATVTTAPAAAPAVVISPVAPETAASGVVASVTPEVPVDDSETPVVAEGMTSQPETVRIAPERVVERGSAGHLASREDRAAPSPIRRAEPPEPAARRSTTSAPQRRSNPVKSEPKRAPGVAPAPVPSDLSGGALAGEASRGGRTDIPEMLHRSGTGSVLGNENIDGRGNSAASDDSRNDRGAVDPTRRTEVPPF